MGCSWWTSKPQFSPFSQYYDSQPLWINNKKDRNDEKTTHISESKLVFGAARFLATYFVALPNHVDQQVVPNRMTYLTSWLMSMSGFSTPPEVDSGCLEWCQQVSMRTLMAPYCASGSGVAMSDWTSYPSNMSSGSEETITGKLFQNICRCIQNTNKQGDLWRPKPLSRTTVYKKIYKIKTIGLWASDIPKFSRRWFSRHSRRQMDKDRAQRWESSQDLYLSAIWPR